MARVLVVDDEPAVQAGARARAEARQLRRRARRRRRGGARRARDTPADAVILDVAMPRLDGLEVCRRMRQAGDRTPVLMLTARDAIDDRVKGLDVGADDYLVKPFALRELQARLRALLRRTGDGADAERSALRRPRARPGRARGPARRSADRALEDRVPAARAVPAPPAPGADPLDDLRERVGLRLRPHLERARRVHGLSAPQDRGRAASRGCCTRCAASATSCGTESPMPLRGASDSRRRRRSRSRSCSRRSSATWSSATSCAARSTTRSTRQQAAAHSARPDFAGSLPVPICRRARRAARRTCRSSHRRRGAAARRRHRAAGRLAARRRSPRAAPAATSPTSRVGGSHLRELTFPVPALRWPAEPLRRARAPARRRRPRPLEPAR